MNDLLEAMNRARTLLPKEKPLLGLFCNSLIHQRLRDECEKNLSVASNYLGSQDCFYGAPIWIDDRLGDDQCEAYYDKKLFEERKKEQNAFDEVSNRLYEHTYRSVFGAFD